MAPRSPTFEKSTTISRRLRSQASKQLSVQPPQLPQIRNLRSRRVAAAVASSRKSTTAQLSVISQSEPQNKHWNQPDLQQSFPRGRTADETDYVSYSAPRSNQLVPQPPELTSTSPYSHSSEPSQYPLSPPSDQGIPSAVQLSQIPQLLPSNEFAQPGDLQNMSAIDFMVPPHYGSMDYYGSSAPLDSHSYSMGQQAQSSAVYAPAYVSSSALRSQSSRPETALPPYQAPSATRSPYQQPLGPMRGSPTPMSYPPPTSGDSSAVTGIPPLHQYAYPAMQHTLPGHPSSLVAHDSSYPPTNAYPPTTYHMGYGSLPTTMYPATSNAAYSYDHADMAQSGAAAGLSSSPEQRNVRVLNQRPKPQCWEHGCNGRQFSTFSNLLRHQREKSGTAAKSYCPRCGAEFTRTTARNGHMAHEKCKSKHTSDTSG